MPDIHRNNLRLPKKTNEHFSRTSTIHISLKSITMKKLGGFYEKSKALKKWQPGTNVDGTLGQVFEF